MQVLTATQDCPLVAMPEDKKENPTSVENAVWTTSDESILTLVADPGGDPLKVTAHAVGPLGSALVTFTADADLGAGVVPVIGTLDFVVNPGMATTVVITAGTPVEQP